MGFHEYATPYDWSRLNAYKRTARAAFGGLIDLSVGSPVDPVPDSVRKAIAIAASEPDAYGYPLTVGSMPLREAIIEWFRECRDTELKAIGADVVPTVGSKEAVALMASLLGFGEGDVVVQPRISYPTYEIGTQIAGATVLKVDDVADTASWEHVDGVKAIWVNSPNNPTGRVLNVDELHGIIMAARRIGAVVLSDECYAMMTWRDCDSAIDTDQSSDRADDQIDENDVLTSIALDPAQNPSLDPDAIVDSAAFAGSPCALRADICDASASNILVLYSLSKQSNMAGYRAALIAGDAELLKPMKDLRKQIGQIVPGPVQAAMAAGLHDVDAMYVQHERYRNRLGVLVQALRAYGYCVNVPDGALYVWVKAKSGDCWQDLEALANLGIVASPGEFYGDARYLRFSVTATDDAIAAAAERLAQ